MAIKEELKQEVKEEGGGKDELDALDALENEAKEYNKDAEIDRIIQAFKLDAYAVLDLQPGVPESEIKICYRKKSLLIHPDKTSNPRAPDAFDRLKKAQTTLMDEKARAHLDECIADARMLLMRARKLTIDSPEVKNPDNEFKAAWRKKTVEVLVDSEARRRKQVKAQMQEEGREQRRVDEEVEERKRKREHQEAWEQTREGRIGSWRDFQQGVKAGKGEGGGEGSKKKKQKMKVLG
ncbi:DnaJ subfamily C member 8 [Lecanora helva]